MVITFAKFLRRYIDDAFATWRVQLLTLQDCEPFVADRFYCLNLMLKPLDQKLWRNILRILTGRWAKLSEVLDMALSALSK